MSGISNLAKEKLGSSGAESHDGENWSFWDGVSDSFSNLWNWISGKDDRDFAQSQSDQAFERQKWFDLNEPSLQVEGMKRAGLNPGLMSGSPQIATPQMATANRIAPGLGDIMGSLSGIMSNVLGVKKTEAETNLMSKQSDALGSQIKVNEALIKQLESITNMNQEQSKLFAKTVEEKQAQIEHLKVQNDFLRWQQPVFQATAKKLNQESLTETYKPGLYGAQRANLLADTAKKEAEINNIGMTTKVVKYNLDHILPKTLQEIGSRIDLNYAEKGRIAQQTQNLVQDFWLKKPEADYIAQNFEDMIQHIGAKKTLEYWSNLSDALDAGIQYHRRSLVPDNPFRKLKPTISNDDADFSGSRKVIYQSLMNFLGNVTQDMAAPIGAGLGLKKLGK